MGNKLLLRWGCITLIGIAYCVVVLWSSFIFLLNYSNITNMGGGFISPQCLWFGEQLQADFDNTILSSLLGFLICTSLILFVFKKIR